MTKENPQDQGESTLEFERLDVYHLALRFIHKLMRVVKSLPAELKSSLGSSVVGAGMSVVDFIVEGSGEKSSKAKRQYYAAGLDSARQCIPIIGILHREGCMTDEYMAELRNDCIEICNKMAELAETVK